MYDPLNLQKQVRQIIAENAEAISDPTHNKEGGWVRIDPFPVVISSLQNVDLFYIKSKHVYLLNGVPLHPWEMRNYLTMHDQSIPVKDAASLPATPKVKDLLDYMFAMLFPFAQYDFNTHKVHIWAFDENGATYPYTEIPLPFFYYESNIISLIVKSQPDKERMDELWDMMIEAAKKGYYYSHDEDNYDMWNLVFVGYDVMKGKARFKGNGNTYYIYTLDDITTPVISTSDNQFSGAVTVDKIKNSIGENFSDEALKKLNDLKSTTTFNQGNTGAKKQENTGWSKNRTNETTIPHADVSIKTDVTFDEFTKFLMTQPYNLEENKDKYIQNYTTEKIDELRNRDTVPTLQGTRVDTLHNHFLPYYTSKDFSKMGANILFDQGVLNNMVLYIISGKPDLYFIAFPPIINLLVDRNDKGESFPSNSELLAIVSGKDRRAGGTSVIQEIPQTPIYLSIIQHIPDTDEYAVATQYGFYRVNQVQAKNIIGQITDMLNHKGDNKKEGKKEDNVYNEEVKNVQKAKVNEKASGTAIVFVEGQPSTQEQINKVKSETKEKVEQIKDSSEISDLLNANLTIPIIKKLCDYYFKQNQTYFDITAKLIQGRNLIVNEMEEKLTSHPDFNDSLEKYQHYFYSAIEDIETELNINLDFAEENSLTDLYQMILADHQLTNRILPLKTDKHEQSADVLIKNAEKEYIKTHKEIESLNHYAKSWGESLARFLSDSTSSPDERTPISELLGIVDFLISYSLLFNYMLTQSAINTIYAQTNNIKQQTSDELHHYFESIVKKTVDDNYPDYQSIAQLTQDISETFAYQFGMYIGQSQHDGYTDSFLNPLYQSSEDGEPEWDQLAVNANDKASANAKKELLASYADLTNRFEYFHYNSNKELDNQNSTFYELLLGILDGFAVSSGNSDEENDPDKEALFDFANKKGYYDIETLLQPDSDFIKHQSIHSSSISKITDVNE